MTDMKAPAPAAERSDWVTNMAAHEAADGDPEISAGKTAQPGEWYEDTQCSSCGRSFGPGPHGFSHCFSHQGPEVWIPELIRNEYDKAPDLGDKGGYPGWESEWNDGADDIARKIIERFAEKGRK